MTYTVTQIEQAKKSTERVNIFLNGKFWIGLSKNNLISLKIMKGREFSDLEKQEIERIALNSKLIDKAIRYIQIRPRSCAEVRDYLVLRKEVPSEDAENVITYLLEKEMLSDEKFAPWYATSKSSYGVNGVNKIKAELLKKRVDMKVIKKVLEKLSKNDEFQSTQTEKLQEYATKVRRTIKAKDAYELKVKLTKRLMARGFKYEDIKKIVI